MIDMILTMSCWVSRRKARPSICWTDRGKIESDRSRSMWCKKSTAADWLSHLVSELFGLFLTARKRLNEVCHLQRERDSSERDRSEKERQVSVVVTCLSLWPAGCSSVGQSQQSLRRHPAAVCGVAPSRVTGRDQAVLTWQRERQTGGGWPADWTLQLLRDRQVREDTVINSWFVLSILSINNEKFFQKGRQTERQIDR